MKQKYKVLLSVLFINFAIFSIYTNFNVKAQGSYGVSINKGDEFVWEVTQLDLELFKEVLGFEPNFKVGDKLRVILRDIFDRTTHWLIEAYFWDYQTDWTQQGSLEYMRAYKNAYFYEQSNKIFLLTPIEDYLQEVEQQFEPKYQVDGAKIIVINRSQTNIEYVHEKSYNDKGVLTTECILEYTTDNVIVEIKGTFVMIPMGIYFIGFTLLAIGVIILISVINKKYLIKVS